MSILAKSLPNGRGLLFLVSRPVDLYQQSARQGGWGSVHFEAPLDFEFLDFPQKQLHNSSGIILTSQTGVESLKGQDVTGLSAWVVGAATAQAARQIGLDVKGVIEGGGAKFAEAIHNGDLVLPAQGLVWASVDQPAFDLVDALGDQGIALHQMITYRSIIKKYPSDSLLHWLSANPKCDVALFSVQCARAFESWRLGLSTELTPLNILLIGPRVALGLSQQIKQTAPLFWPESASRQEFAKILCNFAGDDHMLGKMPSN